MNYLKIKMTFTKRSLKEVRCKILCFKNRCLNKIPNILMRWQLKIENFTDLTRFYLSLKLLKLVAQTRKVMTTVMFMQNSLLILRKLKVWGQTSICKECFVMDSTNFKKFSETNLKVMKTVVWVMDFQNSWHTSERTPRPQSSIKPCLKLEKKFLHNLLQNSKF